MVKYHGGYRYLAVALVWLVLSMNAVMMPVPVVHAIAPPIIDPAFLPADIEPGPDQPMRQSNVCARAITVDQPDIGFPAPGFSMLNITQAWQYSTGHGVAVAVIDTGVSPNSRLPVIAGGDYIMGGDGRTDCDAHGTIVASVIAAVPQGIPMPAPKPALPAFPVPVVSTASAPFSQPASPEQVPLADSGASADGVIGVAPHAVIMSIRQSSRAYEPVAFQPGDSEIRKKAGTIATLASAIVHAANMGAKVINISVTACVSAAEPLDQRAIGAAVWYAATVKDAVIVAAAGNEGEDGCTANPLFDPLDTGDPRDWHHVQTVSSPSWFADYVLSVGGVDDSGAPLSTSLAGPWVGVAAPALGIMGLSPDNGVAVNAYPPVRAGQPHVSIRGTSFSAAYVSGVVALVRAKYPELSAHQVIRRIEQTAHNPARGVDNRVGYGLIDPVAALTFHVEAGQRFASGAQTRVLRPPAAAAAPDHRARYVALIFAAIVMGAVGVTALLSRAWRAR